MQVTQTADETLVTREITLDKANGNPQAIDLGTGNLLPPAVPAGGEPVPSTAPQQTRPVVNCTFSRIGGSVFILLIKDFARTYHF